MYTKCSLLMCKTAQKVLPRPQNLQFAVTDGRMQVVYETRRYDIIVTDTVCFTLFNHIGF